MRSSDPIEGPVFPGLKRIIIIISLPGSGCELYYETLEERPCFQLCEGFQKLRVKRPRVQDSKRCRQRTGIAVTLFLGCLFDFTLEFYVVCMSSAFEVER